MHRQRFQYVAKTAPIDATTIPDARSRQWVGEIRPARPACPLVMQSGNQTLRGAIAVLDHGALLQIGPPADVIAAPASQRVGRSWTPGVWNPDMTIEPWGRRDAC